MRLEASRLRWRCTDRFQTSRGTPRDITLESQKRAVEALAFGLEMEDEGFNIYVAGSEGTGKKWLVLNKAKQQVKKLPVPPDWCYLFNFDDPKSPKALSLPPGRGRRLQEDMKSFIQHIKEELPKAFESKDYEERAKEITEKYNSEKEKLFKQLTRMAEIAGFTVKFTPAGIALFPLMGGQLIPEEKLMADPRLREFVDTKRREIDPLVADYLKRMKDLDKEMNRELRKLREQVALFVINTYIEELKEKYRDLPEVGKHIDQVKEDILKNLELFLQVPSSDNPFATLQLEKSLSKYEVNVIVDNSNLKHAPLVYEKNPTYSNLFGKIGARAEFGLYVTDFTQIVPGSIHKANGGVLILRIRDVLINPGVWHALKKALLHKEINIQHPLEDLGFTPPVSSLFKPQPIPLKLKVILMGDRLTFSLLGLLDPEFSRLFKVKAEFTDYVPNTPENRRLFAHTMREIAKSQNLLPLSPGAVAAIIETSVRLSENRNRLSLQVDRLLDTLKEANYIAQRNGKKRIDRRDVERAVRSKVFRSDLLQEVLSDAIADGSIIVELDGEKVGQIYGVAIIGNEDYSFGKPVRITAAVYCGNKGVISIERETKLAGKIFEKAILTLSGYLGRQYGRNQPLSLCASIAFEQSYSTIEGDSATLAELLCVLSAISGLPLKQNTAVTGSVDQLGNVQPVGGINEKIEGFHRVCRRLNRKGRMIIPSRNIHNLQLDRAVVEDVKRGYFEIHAVNHVDEAIEIAFGISPDEVHKRVRESLEKLHKYSSKEEKR